MNIFEKTFWSGLSKRVKIIGIATVACILTVAIILLSFFISAPEKSHFLYLKNRELYYTNLNNNLSFQVTEQLIDLDNTIDDSIYDEKFDVVETALSTYCKFSNDGNTLFYIDNIIDLTNGAPLYYRYLSNTKSTPKLIDSAVKTYVLSETGTKVTYINGEDGALYQHNLKEKIKIDDNVSEFVASSDGKNIIYVKNGEVYTKLGDNTATKLGNITSTLYSTNGSFDTVFFMDNDLLYKIKDGKKVTQLASDVGEIVEHYSTGEIYYLKTENEVQISLAEHLIDDAKSLDDSLVEPEYPASPEKADYKTEAEYQEAVKQFEVKYEEYLQLDELWSQKREHDKIREDVLYDSFTHTYSSLCYHDGKKEKVLNENVTSIEYSALGKTKPTLIFQTSDYKELKKVKISQVESIEDLTNMLKEGLDDLTVTYLTVENVTSAIGYGENRDYCITEDGKTVYFLGDINYEESFSGDLYEMKISGKKPREPKLYDSGVIYSTTAIYNGSLIYYKNFEKGVSELYCEKEKIADNVMMQGFSSLPKKDSYVYIANWVVRASGDLFIYENGKSKKIDQDINSFSVTDSGVILYFKDYNQDYSTGNLYAYKDGKTQEIGKDITMVIESINFDAASGPSLDRQFY